MDGYDREVSRSFGAIARFLKHIVGRGTDLDRADVEDAIAMGLFRARDRDVLFDLLGLANADEQTRLVPEEQRRHVLQLARHSVLAATEGGPVVFAVEDLHWLDVDSVAFLDQLVTELSGLPILLVATFRPGFQVQWIGQSSFRLLRLMPLNPEEAETLLSQWQARAFV